MKNFKVIVCFVLVIYAEASTRICGAKTVQRVKRVVDGIIVPQSDYKFMLSMKYTKNSEHFCGATRIAEKWALTAAHCIIHVKPTQFFVTTTKNQSILIEQTYVQDFDPVTFENDIALLKLKIRQDKNVTKALLPSHLAKSGERCLILGEGATEYAGPNSESLRSGVIDVITYEDCQSKLGRYMAPRENAGMFCAGGDGVDACNGDSGGPILCKNNCGQYELTGVISYGMGCGTVGVPGVYTDIYHHFKWINETVLKYNFHNNINI